MKYIITEEQLKKIVKLKKLYEDSQPSQTKNVKIENRDSSINSDGTISIKDKNGNMQKVRMSLTVGGDVNLVDIKKTSGGYEVTSRSGRKKVIDMGKINNILSFVDTGKPSKIESGSWTEPDLLLKKIG